MRMSRTLSRLIEASGIPASKGIVALCQISATTPSR
jgi:hypothetical protein